MSHEMTVASAAPLHKLLAAAKQENSGRPPVWFMRQAGRYLPQYRAVRQRTDFLTMVRTPELAAEVTLQPVDLIGVDAAIIFSDILVVPEAMGMHLEMHEGSGPRFPSPVREMSAIKALRAPDVEDAISYTLDAIRLTRRALAGRVPLIGFAGAPWTLASYMIEGEGTKHFHVVKQLVFSQPAAVHELLARLTIVVGDFLVAQVKAGAQIVQLFDSWASALGPREFAEFALPYASQIVERVRRETGVPVIMFAPGAGASLTAMTRATGAEVIGIDWQTSPQVAREGFLGAMGMAPEIKSAHGAKEATWHSLGRDMDVGVGPGDGHLVSDPEGLRSIILSWSPAATPAARGSHLRPVEHSVSA